MDDAWGTELAYYRSQYGFGARAGHDVPLSNTRASMGDQSGYRVATGKGVLFLHALRGLMGEVVFDRAMQEFGRQHGGQKVSTQQFQGDFLQRRTAYQLTPVFDWWLHQTGLPYLAVQSAPDAARRCGLGNGCDARCGPYGAGAGSSGYGGNGRRRQRHPHADI